MRIRSISGFTFLELMIAGSILAILAGVAMYSYAEHYKAYKFRSYATSAESLVRWAKMTSKERSINVGICAADRTLKATDMGSSRTGHCSGNELGKIEIKSEDAFVTLAGSGFAFDPRGFAVVTGNVCVMKGAERYRICASRFGASKMEKGSGGCTSCAN